ncbi:nuclear GTPase SLIP-GC-like isoform X2 [Sardina pilchardus]|uniref:nuclear GTPase SLIP-GC-like isoform X2 n=1 Tax=Sardina pilchardus TaxID=27697 RepID=UPI002E10AF17
MAQRNPQGINEANQIFEDVMKKIEADANEETDAFSQYIRSLIKDPKSKKTKVGVIGRTGVGKSYLINTILGEKVLPSGSELACTSVIIQVEANDPQKTDFTAEIKLISKQDWEHELEILRLILDKGTHEYEESDVKSARDKIKAVYGQDGVNKTLEQLKSVVIPDLVDKTEICPTAEELERAIRRYVKSGEADSTQLFYWPLVKSVTIKVPGHNDILENLVLIDLPGTGDINKSRREMGKNYLRECSTIWILSDINRAASDQSSWEILSFHLKDMAHGGECSNICYICTKTDADMDAEDANNYMSNNDLTEGDLGITQEQLTENTEKIKIRKCIVHRNEQSKKRIENAYREQIQGHFSHVDFKVFTVSSKEFQKKDNNPVLLEEDTEIPALRRLLRNLNVRFSKKIEDEYIKEVEGVLSLIQGSKCDRSINFEIAKERRQAYRTLNEELTEALTDLCQSLREKYNALDQCLSKFAEKSMTVSPREAEKKVIKPDIPTFQGYHKTLKALCVKGGVTVSKDTGKVTDLNGVLVSHMKENMDRTFHNLFERSSRQTQSVPAMLQKFDPISDVMDDFSPHVKLILIFIKTQLNKRKTALEVNILLRKKGIYNCLKDNIESAMLPVYEDAASESGEGAFRRMQDMLRAGIEENKAIMYKGATLKMLEKFDHMTNHIEKTLRELQDIVADALSLRFILPLPDITEEVKRMKRVVRVDDGIFLKESPAAAAASASSSHSDAADLHLRDKVQQDPGAQLLSLDTHTEDHHIDAPQRSCESCAEVPDSSHWDLVKPEVSTEESVSTYSLRSDKGSYECPESGLRWTCAGPVTLQYRSIDWHVLADELVHLQLRPAGPLMDIRLMSGELEEIHLPHFLCLGSSEASEVCDAVRVLHKRESGVCVEVCELTRHHARLVHPSFSWLGVVLYPLKQLFSKIHWGLLLVCNCAPTCSPTCSLVFHASNIEERPEGAVRSLLHYRDRTGINSLELQEEALESVRIDPPGAVGRSPAQGRSQDNVLGSAEEPAAAGPSEEPGGHANPADPAGSTSSLLSSSLADCLDLK